MRFASVVTRRRWRVVVAAALLMATARTGTPSRAVDRGALRVRASEAFAPCLLPALEAFSAESGLAVVLEVGDPDPPREADVVVGDDSEMTRLLEGGIADLRTSFDLGYLPWVFVVPERSGAETLSVLAAAERVHVLGGPAGREAREALGATPAERLRVSRDGEELRRARYALVPVSLAGTGERRRAEIRPLVATAAAVAATARPADVRRLLEFLRSERGRRALSPCLAPSAEAAAGAAVSSREAAVYARAVLDWWLPECSLTHNGYNDPQQVLGPPDAVNLGGKDLFRGLMSLGQGGWVTVDMGISAVDGPGADIRIYQTTGNEPVTLYAATSPQGPFVLVGLRESCGVRSPGVFSNHCDFDLRAAGLTEARYLKIEDGEIYPCLAGGTITEGADIDAVELLNSRP